LLRRARQSFPGSEHLQARANVCRSDLLFATGGSKTGIEMLRISTRLTSTGVAIVKLEGRIAELSVDLLAGTCWQLLIRQEDLHLDLAGVSFIDSDGIIFLHSLPVHRVVL
jgi:hypothetical protein